MLQIWERAQHEVRMAETTQANLEIAGELSLWNSLLLDWLLWLRGNMPETPIHAGVELSSSLVQKVLQNTIDIGVIYTPQYHPQLQVELLTQETLIMVSTEKVDDIPASTSASEYIYIDWGSQFMDHHRQAFPELRHSAMSVGFGPLALQYILKAGGHGYFRACVVQPYIESGRLHRVTNASEFIYPIYTVHAVGRQEPHVHAAIQGLKEVAKKTDPTWAI
jgi:DNA-binding transcriptional LysR family regulator